ICQLYFEGKVEAAAKLQIDYSDLIDALFCEVNPIPVKAALKLLGCNVGKLRMPLSEIEPQNLEKVRAALIAHNLLPES
ncbi:MAG: dihydrodipicolinate synthase family protein, partial [Selenomonadaceae bacterium]|nr:dihydrodipicolinate synthase family protein [Selenomonadaceae bacterium]